MAQNGKRLRGSPGPRAEPCRSIWQLLMTRPLVRRATSPRSSCRRPIRPLNGPTRCEGRRSRLRRQLSYRREAWDYHGCRGIARHPAGRGRRLADHDRADRSLLWHQACMAGRRHPPMARPPTSIGWSTSRGSRRMCRSSTNRSAKMARSRAMTSSTTRCKTSYTCPAGKTC